MAIHSYLFGFGCLALGLAAACDAGGDGKNDDGRGLDAFTPDAEREATIWDGGSSDGPRPPPPRRDAGTGDMGVASCFAGGRGLVESYVSDPVPGLVAVRADVDPDGDDQPDFLLTVATPGGSELRFLDGRSAEPRGSITGPAGTTLDFMPGLWPMPDLLAPISVDDAPAWYLLERTEAATALRVVSAEDGADIRRIELPGGVADLTVFSTGTGWLVLVNQADGGCAVHSLGVEEPLASQGRCRVRPAWDVNGDGALEIARSGGAGTALLDGKLLEPIAEIQPPSGMLGYIPVSEAADAPAPGAFDARGRGPEVVAARAENDQLFVTYHDPVDLRPTGDALPVPGTFLRLEFWLTAGGLRLLAEEERGGLRYLHIFDPGPMRKRGEYGPFPNLFWSGGLDLDADGYAELFTVTGPRDDGLNDDHHVRNASDGAVLLSLGSERGARFQPFFRRRSGLGARADLDGCPGDELPVLRIGAVSGTGARPTRLQIVGPAGGVAFRDDPRSGRVHDLALADLDGIAPVEIIEVRSDGDDDARLRVFR